MLGLTQFLHSGGHDQYTAHVHLRSHEVALLIDLIYIHLISEIMSSRDQKHECGAIMGGQNKKCREVNIRAET
jgi:hypothetical protein